MAREHGTSDPPWGTLEELLLVCAVNRHGTTSWDSVAMEVQSRSSTVASTLLTAHNCRDKFDDLKRRFISENDTKSQSLDQMVDELRDLRVQELRREVRRRNVSIESLELKVKRLEEERGQGLKEEAEARPNMDRQRGGEDQPDTLPGKDAGKTNSGEDSDERENRSFNESNSTSQRGEAKENGVVAEQSAEEEPVPDGNQPDPVRPAIRPEPDRGCSVNGKVMDDEDRVKNRKRKKGGNTVVASRLGKSNEFWESMVESKREGKRGRVATKQNSDVQSSASLSKTKRRRGGGGGGGDEGGSRSRSRRSSSGEEAEGDEVSPATNNGVKLELIKHEPLVKVLRIIRSHRLGSVFERRLRSQESQRYKSLIREHMDLHAIQSSLNKGAYKDCTHKFFRDLLLLINNAVVFFRKASPEHGAAQELRSIVLKEMAEQLPKSQPSIPTVKITVPKIESDGSSRPRKSSIVGCGRRGSINALSESGSARNRKGVKKMEDDGDGDAGFVKSEDEGVRKKRTQERGRGRGSRARNSKNTVAGTKNYENHEYGGNELSSHDGLEGEKLEKKENVKKKQGAARFLKRMKQNSSSNEVKKGSSEGSEDDSEDSMVEEEEEEKKTVNRARKKPVTERKERVTRSSTGRGGGRRDQESSGRGRRGVGRPPKPSGAGNGKRGRDNGEADQLGSAGRPRKRTRR